MFVLLSRLSLAGGAGNVCITAFSKIASIHFSTPQSQPHNGLEEIIGDLRPFINNFDLNDILVMHFQNRNDPALDLLRPQPSVFVTI